MFPNSCYLFSCSRQDDTSNQQKGAGNGNINFSVSPAFQELHLNKPKLQSISVVGNRRVKPLYI